MGSVHRRAKECAGAGEQVDSRVGVLSAHWGKERTSLTFTGAAPAAARFNSGLRVRDSRSDSVGG